MSEMPIRYRYIYIGDISTIFSMYWRTLPDTIRPRSFYPTWTVHKTSFNCYCWWWWRRLV